MYLQKTKIKSTLFNEFVLVTEYGIKGFWNKVNEHCDYCKEKHDLSYKLLNSLLAAILLVSYTTNKAHCYCM